MPSISSHYLAWNSICVCLRLLLHSGAFVWPHLDVRSSISLFFNCLQLKFTTPSIKPQKRPDLSARTEETRFELDSSLKLCFLRDFLLLFDVTIVIVCEQINHDGIEVLMRLYRQKELKLVRNPIYKLYSFFNYYKINTFCYKQG